MPTSTSVRAAIAEHIRTYFTEGNAQGYLSVFDPSNVKEGYAGVDHGLSPVLSDYPRLFIIMEDSDYVAGVSRKMDKKQLLTFVCHFQVAAQEDTAQSTEELEAQVNSFVSDIERMVITNPTLGSCTQITLRNQEDDLGNSPTVASVVMQAEAQFSLRY